MKISKLFHWLYATLMFLPFIFLLPTLAYYGFNEHATNTETTTINYKYQSNEVNTENDLIIGNIYNFETYAAGLFNLVPNDNDYIFCELLTPLKVGTGDLQFDDYTGNFEYLSPNLYINIVNAIDYCYIDAYYTYEQFVNYDYYAEYLFTDFFLSDCVVRLLEYQFAEPEVNVFEFGYTDYNVIESVEVNTDNTITSAVSRSWDSVWNLPLFSWTHNSFVSEPFTYITGLFGMSADNPFNYVVTYFVSISVCWLVFDFLMYVPNLAHRWLDKGALE